VTAFLLDVNVLVALAREDHAAHRDVKGWFQGRGARRWATSALTEAGFVRVVSNPRFSETPLDVSEVMAMLAALTTLPGHQFWPIDFNFAEAAAPFEARFFGHQQVTDIYLLALAIRNKGKLVTLDRGIAALAGSEYLEDILVL
jgi:uncharacterized protein